MIGEAIRKYLEATDLESIGFYEWDELNYLRLSSGSRPNTWLIEIVTRYEYLPQKARLKPRDLVEWSGTRADDFGVAGAIADALQEKFWPNQQYIRLEVDDEGNEIKPDPVKSVLEKFNIIDG